VLHKTELSKIDFHDVSRRLLKDVCLYPCDEILIRTFMLFTLDFFYSYRIFKIKSIDFAAKMANDRADDMGRWTFEPTFAPQGATVQPDGTITSEEIPLEHIHGSEHNIQSPGDVSQVATAPNLSGQGNGLISDVVPHIEPVEHRHDPTLPLNSRDVCAFIVNKMIGTGIFIQPPAVLLFTQSKVEALFLWVLGFLYTLVRYAPFSRKDTQR
jgi:hypothetical protein